MENHWRILNMGESDLVYVCGRSFQLFLEEQIVGGQEWEQETGDEVEGLTQVRSWQWGAVQMEKRAHSGAILGQFWQEFWFGGLGGLCLILFFFWSSLWDLSSLTRDQTQAYSNWENHVLMLDHREFPGLPSGLDVRKWQGQHLGFYLSPW